MPFKAFVGLWGERPACPVCCCPSQSLTEGRSSVQSLRETEALSFSPAPKFKGEVLFTQRPKAMAFPAGKVWGNRLQSGVGQDKPLRSLALISAWQLPSTEHRLPPCLLVFSEQSLSRWAQTQRWQYCAVVKDNSLWPCQNLAGHRLSLKRQEIIFNISAPLVLTHADFEV